MKLLPYPRYKPSGIEWLGKLPEHWEVTAIRRVIERLDQGWSPNALPWPASDNEWGVLKLGASRQGIFVPLENKALDDEPVDFPVVTPRSGDLLVSRSNTPERVGDVCLVPCDHPRLLVPDLLFRVKLDSTQAEPTYACFFLLSRAGRAQIEMDARGSSGSMVKLGQDHVRSWRIPCPPVPEQRAIADFLDRETAKIDTLVGKKRTLIERLKEKRAALISRTVTRGLPPDAARAAGLDPHPKLKPSGIDWLGDVPEHWEIVRIGRRIMLQRGVDITKDEQNEGPVPVVSSGGVSSYHDHSLVSGPGVVVGRKGTAGAVYYIDTDFWPHDTTLWVKEFRGSFPRYVFYKLCTMDLGSFDTGSANPTLNRNLVHPVFVSWPPVKEQRAIADYLDYETAKIDQMIAKIEAVIDRLLEYRSALITAAVTGKIDVRTLCDGSHYGNNTA